MADLDQTLRLRTAIQAIRANARLELAHAGRDDDPVDARLRHEAACMLEAAELLETVLVRRRGERESVRHALEPMTSLPDDGDVRLVG